MPQTPPVVTRQVAEQVMAAVTADRRDLIQSVVTDDVELRMPPRRVYWGKAGIDDFLDALAAQLPNTVAVTDATYAGEDFAVVEFEAGGGRPESMVDTTGCAVFVFNGPLIKRIQLYVDTQLWEQLSA